MPQILGFLLLTCWRNQLRLARPLEKETMQLKMFCQLVLSLLICYMCIICMRTAWGQNINILSPSTQCTSWWVASTIIHSTSEDTLCHGKVSIWSFKIWSPQIRMGSYQRKKLFFSWYSQYLFLSYFFLYLD